MFFWSSLLDVVALLAAAWLLGALCERLRQSAIMGYLMAGMLLGPHALHRITTPAEVSHLAELGVSLLLFTIGLEFSWGQLRALGRLALGGGILQVLVTGLVTAGGAALCGAAMPAALTIGAAVALSSTASVLRTLRARSELDSVRGRQCLGILLVQDVAVVPLVLLVSALGNGATGPQILASLGTTLLVAVALVLLLVVLFRLVAPRLLRSASVSSNRELSTLLGLLSGIGASALAHECGLSPALGAFVAGMVLAESPFASQVRADVGSLRTLLVTLFFSSVGMLADPAWMLRHLGPLFLTVAAILAGKSLVTAAVLRLLGATPAHALATGITLAQIGEFSFVIAGIGQAVLLDEFLFSLLVSATLVTMFLSPVLVTAAPRLAGLLTRHPHSPLQPPRPAPGHHVVIGCGPAGRLLVDHLLERSLPVTVLDLNPHTIAELKRLGCVAFVCDATNPACLELLSLHTATTVLLSTPDPRAAALMIQMIRARAPHLPIIARARYNRQYQSLVLAGATAVIDEEKGVALHMLRTLKEQFERAETPTAGEGNGTGSGTGSETEAGTETDARIGDGLAAEVVVGIGADVARESAPAAIRR